MRISFGRRLTGGRHSSSVTCMSCKLGTPREDWESLAPRKKSDSSYSAGAGEEVDDVDRESWTRSSRSPRSWEGMGNVEDGKAVASSLLDCPLLTRGVVEGSRMGCAACRIFAVTVLPQS
jgi:hypothetical protein